MGRLEKLFGLVQGEDEKSDVERLETIEELVKSGDFDGAIAELEKLRKDENVYVGAEVIIRGLLNPELELDPGRIAGYLKSIIPIVNGLESWRYRAIVMADIAIAFYRIGDEFNGDMALKTAINLAYAAGEDVLVEILRELIKSGILEKAAYAFSLVRDRKKIDFLLSHLVEFFYLSGDYDKAMAALEHINDHFYRTVAWYRLALLEASKDRSRALTYLDEAIRNAGEIENKYARVELLMKLSDLKAQLTGKGLTLAEILKGGRSPSSDYGEDANQEH